MTHAVTTIRDRISTVLSGIGGLTVTVSRMYDYLPSDLPACEIEVGESEITHEQMGGNQMWETVFILRIFNQDTTDMDASTFDQVEAVLNALGADHTLSGDAIASEPSAVSAAEKSTEADQPIETREISYRVLFEVASAAQGTPL